MHLRIEPDQLAALDTWIAEQEGGRTRPEAIRHLLDKALDHAAAKRGTSPIPNIVTGRDIV